MISLKNRPHPHIVHFSLPVTLISHKTFNLVQELLPKNAKPKTIRKPSILSRIVICGDCGKLMVRHTCTKNRTTYKNLICPSSKKKGNDICSTHIISEDVVIEVIIVAIQAQVDCALNIERALKKLQQRTIYTKNINYIEEEIKTLQHKKQRNDILKKGLYEDFKAELISKPDYMVYRTEYQKQSIQFEEAIISKYEKITDIAATSKNDYECIDKLKSLSNIKKLTRELVIELIDKILSVMKKIFRLILNLKTK